MEQTGNNLGMVKGLPPAPPTSNQPHPSPGPPRSARLGAWLSWLTGVGALVAFMLAWQTGGQTRSEWTGPLPLIQPVPDFELTNQAGEPVRRSDLLGKVWVADFIYTQCPGPCPTLSTKMRAIQQALDKDRDQIRLVSFSLEPSRDTPSVLQDYARRFHADGNTWWFLTGLSDDATRDLVVKGFLQAVTPGTGDNPMIHSSYMAVVDRRGWIRSFHNGLEPDSRAKIIRDLRALLADPDGP